MDCYNIKKISNLDNNILKKIYNELEKINIRKTYASNGKGQYHSIKTGATNQLMGRQTCFGMTTYQGKKVKSKSTIRYPHIFPLFKKFMKSHYPDFKFQSVQVNKNVVCKKHLDSRNVGKSLIVGVGDYVGGRTVLYSPTGIKKINIKTQSLIFNGSEIPHRSEKFKGTRISLVFF